ncbi:hypothetical protein QYS48_31765 [Marivirga arenosa]|uniref:Uncharacterized protein n=1 Tax=Marivirga arenosa TaxID=3059076 RepID=A0AA51N4G2_9BACT|nr:hypothetical protein [Marivirga sp. ABR2-2]WMN06146.1 hypothetical protein QYS48_31765 [Marivirga sp. ABR2-2]
MISKYGQIKVEDLTNDSDILKAFQELESLKQQHENISDEKERLSFYKEDCRDHIEKINGLLEGLDVLEGVEVVK